MGPYLEIQNDDLYGYQYKKLFKKIKTVYFIFQPVFNVILTDFRFNVNSWSLLEVPFTPPRNFHPSQCEIVRVRLLPDPGAGRASHAQLRYAEQPVLATAGLVPLSPPGQGGGGDHSQHRGSRYRGTGGILKFEHIVAELKPFASVSIFAVLRSRGTL